MIDLSNWVEYSRDVKDKVVERTTELHIVQKQPRFVIELVYFDACGVLRFRYLISFLKYSYSYSGTLRYSYMRRTHMQLGNLLKNDANVLRKADERPLR